MDESAGDIDRPGLAPSFRLARVAQGIGKHVSINEEPGGVWVDAARIVYEAFDTSARIQSETQPFLQHFLRVHGLERRSAIPLGEQYVIGFGENSSAADSAARSVITDDT